MSDHVLHITKVADNESDDVQWTIDCPKASGSCMVWYVCAVEGCSIKSPYDREDDDPEDGLDTVERHGVEHQYIEGDWMIASDRCATVETDISEAVWEIASDRGVGDWPVEVEYLGDGMWWVNDLTDVRA